VWQQLGLPVVVVLVVLVLVLMLVLVVVAAVRLQGMQCWWWMEVQGALAAEQQAAMLGTARGSVTDGKLGCYAERGRPMPSAADRVTFASR
jgi:hypothetical protein